MPRCAFCISRRQRLAHRALRRTAPCALPLRISLLCAYRCCFHIALAQTKMINKRDECCQAAIIRNVA
jgi:hypothetical protein